ncbi:MAG: rRNA adenine dimethyltransferase family protein [Planctomycetota bacterium]
MALHAVERDPAFRASDLGMRCVADARQWLVAHAEDLSRRENRDRLIAVGQSWGPRAAALLATLAEEHPKYPALAWLLEGPASPDEPNPPSPPAALAGVQARPRSPGFRPSRRFGQNFLLDENTARAIVHDAGVGPEDRVLEVGTGCGFLTIHLAHQVGTLLTVEIDLRLADVAQPFLDPYPSVTLLRGDILASKQRLNPEVEAFAAAGPWHLVANLPYAVSGPVLALCAALPNPPESITVLVQKEMAQRLVARPGSRDYGPLSIGLGWVYSGRILRDVGGSPSGRARRWFRPWRLERTAQPPGVRTAQPGDGPHPPVCSPAAARPWSA